MRWPYRGHGLVLCLRGELGHVTGCGHLPGLPDLAPGMPMADPPTSPDGPLSCCGQAAGAGSGSSSFFTIIALTWRATRFASAIGATLRGFLPSTLPTKEPSGGTGQRRVWTAPAQQVLLDVISCMFQKQLCARPVLAGLTAGPDGVGNPRPNQFCGRRCPSHSAGDLCTIISRALPTRPSSKSSQAFPVR